MKHPRLHLRDRCRALRSFGLAAAVLATTAMAAVLPPGGTIALHGTTLALLPGLKATVVQDANHPITLTTPSGPLLAVYHERVAKEVATGTLDFYFWLETVKKPLQADKVEVVLTSYKGFLTGAEYRTDGSGLMGPYQAKRDPTGTAVTFTFRGVTIGPAPAQWTRSAFVRTNSKIEKLGGIARISVDGLAPAAVKIYQP